jgi:hypothetical protein
VHYKLHSADSSTAFSTTQAADNLPLYGVCCYMEEMVHRPPALLASKYPNSTKPLSRYLVAAPRCYAFLTHFPFFALHMKVGACSLEPSGSSIWSLHCCSLLQQDAARHLSSFTRFSCSSAKT